MKYLLLLSIRVYWYFWAEKERRHCIFKKSCSKHVHEITERQGLVLGLKALKQRYEQCRPGYRIYTEDQDIYVRLVDGSTIPNEKASQDIVIPYKSSISKLEQSLNT